METIYCLFGIDNNYDQPKNNLICAWTKKPSHDELKDILKSEYGLTDKKVNDIRKKGYQLQIETGGTAFRLEEVIIGKKL